MSAYMTPSFGEHVLTIGLISYFHDLSIYNLVYNTLDKKLPFENK